ncbi:MAG: type II toxin-antitoxin system ParD family antitoxin [Candidatus Eisenbacteria bacterium]|uniref:Type II toxin-antitoxin system ParD family antitoxin n=1 Tax=Eiseniibacteriota bacterium TaxID=2212470 RepID=A0A956NKA6_UNCEI|nr:type II toxin-antitoxin system ParD family antitoxin [Candidatus Eisenbacteria bacterium]MCB9466046.1 type II toxin-antitoxin system ParD family antitoxin [Candidatus Eisenbacteria bacterium]
MTNMNISLPEPMRAWVEDQIRQGRYGDASEYVRDLIRRDQERLTQDRLEQLLLEGLESGESLDVTPEFWEPKRREVVARVRERAKGRTESGG